MHEIYPLEHYFNDPRRSTGIPARLILWPFSLQ